MTAVDARPSVDSPVERRPDEPSASKHAGAPNRHVSTVVLHVALFAGLVVMALPFVWMILGSFKTTSELRKSPPTWIPNDPTFGNFRDLVDQLDFPRYFFNSLLVAVLVTVGNLVFCSMLGYALAKLAFPGKRALFVVVLSTLMVPAFVTFMPLFVLVSNLHIVNTHAGLILPFLAGGLGVFLMRQFIEGIPDDLLDAARVDGAGEYTIFFRIVLPLCGPALATLGVLVFLAQWNSFLWPLVVASTEDMYTLPVALALFATGQQESNLALQLAGASVVVLPVVLLFFALQRYVIQGIATTGLK
jgi:multiple sugar transport system permease protein